MRKLSGFAKLRRCSRAQQFELKHDFQVWSVVLSDTARGPVEHLFFGVVFRNGRIVCAGAQSFLTADFPQATNKPLDEIFSKAL
jgi:hypothetical protein